MSALKRIGIVGAVLSAFVLGLLVGPVEAQGVRVTNTGFVVSWANGLRRIVAVEGTSYVVPPKVNGHPAQLELGAEWINIAPGCNRRMVWEDGTPQCATAVPCPVECL